MKVPRKLDDLLKRERCLELLSKRFERVMSKLAGQDAPKAIQIGQITAYLNDGAVQRLVWPAIGGATSEMEGDLGELV